MYCPQCGTESPAGLQYCRVCGANLKMIGKAVHLSEAIARSDRGPLPKIKEMMKGISEKAKLEKVAEDISHALEQMNKEIVKSSEESKFWGFRKKKTARQRREEQLTKGVVSLFGGAGLTIFLYYLAASLVLKIPPDVVPRIPFEVEPVARIFWTIGFVPMLSGVGHLLAGLLIRPDPNELLAASEPPLQIDDSFSREGVSVTDRTTNILEHRVKTKRE